MVAPDVTNTGTQVEVDEISCVAFHYKAVPDFASNQPSLSTVTCDAFFIKHAKDELKEINMTLVNEYDSDKFIPLVNIFDCFLSTEEECLTQVL
jgi:hypothetical protein